MSRKVAITTVIIDIVGIFVIITIPITILLIEFSNYDTIDESLTFYYTPSTPSPIEELSLNAEVGNIEVRYSEEPTDYYIKIEVNIDIKGSNMVGKSHSDYFEMVWHNASSPTTFALERKSGASNWFVNDVSININLKANIVFDINITGQNGNLDIYIPFGVVINNIETRAKNGNLTLDFINCFIKGDITSMVTNGNLALNTHNVEYARDCTWSLVTENGNVYLGIYQHKEMGANVIGTVIPTGLNAYNTLFYRDNSANIGAKFAFPGVTAPPSSDTYNGFDYYPELPNGQSGWLFISEDFPAKTNYNLTFYTWAFIDILSV